MIKNFSHITLSFLLLLATTGMAVSKHFCGDFLVSTVLFSKPDSCCDDDNCCHNELEFYQVDEDFFVPAFAQIPQTLELELFFAVVKFEYEIFGKSDEKSIYAERKPPSLHKKQTVLSLKQTWLL
jgi:hypothetical protein